MSESRIIPAIIAGQPWIGPDLLDVHDKYHGTLIAQVPRVDQGMMKQAINAAYRSRRATAQMAPFTRRAILLHCHRRIEQRKMEFVDWLVREGGKPYQASIAEVNRCLETFSIAAEEAVRFVGEMVPMQRSPRLAGYRGMTQRRPIGALGLITPFNFPLNLVAHKVAPAIAAGCPFVLKPASYTPVVSLLLGEILCETMQETELPPDSFSIVPCDREVGTLLATDDSLSMLSFTGSDSVGWELKRLAHRKRVCLELGGNAACIVDETCDWKSIVSRIMLGGFSQSGQSCISIQRLLIHRSIYAPFVQELKRLMDNLKTGDPQDQQTVVGPVISSRDATRLMQSLQEAIGRGAKCYPVPHREGNVVSACLLEDVPEDHPLVCEEAFGPVMVARAFDHFEEAIELTNQSKYGLQIGLFTNNLQRAMQAWDEIEAGSIVINEVPNWRADQMPYGGIKESGVGREGVRYAMEEMTEPRLLVIRDI